jgi:acetyltransferase
MDIEEIRQAVRAAIASIAPGCDVARIVPGRPLREQIDLDSMDWLNLIAALHERLRVDIPASDYGRLETLEAMVSYLASRRTPSAAPAAATGSAASPPVMHARIGDTTVTVRPMRADDDDLEADFVRHLSPDSRYKRFMGVLTELSPAKLKYLTDVDGVSHVALIATMQHEGREAPLGVARYVVDASGASCEFAIAVDDAWQRTGVAGFLMKALLDTARARGLARMEGIVLATNAQMLKFARQLGFSLQPDPDDRKTVRVVREL